ncbi:MULTISPECIES: tyrosine-type recombinase/integrase [unclassified Helicobacter]|uniref:tyrosine-type recombinase/integrase n=1 Tax=unclassified Helicobacter TaxID=2593540 RepID=UPI000CF0379D|nr:MULTISPECIES: tyrosine-type recombinase/integrase [unclassified Helicobacter]
MKYPLEEKKSVSQNILNWMRRYLRYKITTLSNRLVKNKDTLLLNLNLLQEEITSIQTLQDICKNVRNAGLIGINTYAQPLLKLYDFLEKKNLSSMKDIDEEMLSDFLVFQTSTLSIQTKKNYRIALIDFFNYIDKQNQDGNTSYVFGISLKINSIKSNKPKLPTYLKEEEIKSFLDALSNFPMKQSIAPRDKLIITLIIYTGIRVSEALGLSTKDIIRDNDSYLLHIKGKGGKSRVVIIKSIHIEKWLEEWLKLRSQMQNIDNQLLFCNKNGKMLSQAYIYKNVENILHYAGIKKEKMGAHMLRHSFATLLYKKHKDLILVQEALGHADLNTSRIYTHFDKDQLTKVANLMENLK